MKINVTYEIKEETTQRKEPKSKVKTILIIIAVVVGFIIGGHIYNYIRNFGKNALTEFPSGVMVDDFDKFMETKKNIASDINGLSQYDKYKMGLDYKDGSDSDNDGLTDKEEIEKYKTDPLKESTAGDLYTDGYKVKKNMDLFSVCEYKGKISFKHNHCSEVKLEADEPSDLNAVIDDYTNRYSLECYGINKIYKGYWMYNYEGTAKIDLTSVFKRNDIGYGDIKVWVIQGAFVVNGLSELEECVYKENGNAITLEYDFVKTNEYYIYITENKKVSIGAALSTTTETSGIGFIYGFPVIEQLFGTGMHVDYLKMETEEKSKSLAKHSVNYCNTHMGSKIKYSDTGKVKKKSKSSINLKNKIFSMVLPIFKYDPKEGENIFNFIFSYMPYSDSGYDIGAAPSNSNDRDDAEEVSDVEGFNIYKDELPFQNFESEIGEGGNCVGIAHLTSYLYNKKKFPSSGSCKCKINGKKKEIKWNLKKDPANKTLMDVGLYDYKNSSFVDEHSGNGTNYLSKELSKGEKQFKKMIGCYWTKGNKKINLNDYANTNGRHDDYTMIEKMIDYLDQGKIVDVYMLMKGGFGHAVNVYGYEYYDDKEVTFYVYDSNLPQDKRSGFELNFEICALQVKKLEDVNGKDKFEYLYYPLKGRNNITYMASSNQGLMSTNAIVILDENWNVFK